MFAMNSLRCLASCSADRETLSAGPLISTLAREKAGASLALIQHRELNPNKIDILKVKEVRLTPARKAYFQVDGEYRGKASEIHAAILPGKLNIVVPPNNTTS